MFPFSQKENSMTKDKTTIANETTQTIRVTVRVFPSNYSEQREAKPEQAVNVNPNRYFKFDHPPHAKENLISITIGQTCIADNIAKQCGIHMLVDDSEQLREFEEEDEAKLLPLGRFGSKINTPRIYLYTNQESHVAKKILYANLSAKYELQPYNQPNADGLDLNGIVLVYSEDVGRGDSSIKTAFDGSPGNPKRKILVLFKNEPTAMSNDVLPSNKRDGDSYIVWLMYSRYTNELQTSSENERNLTDLMEHLNDLTINVTPV